MNAHTRKGTSCEVAAQGRFAGEGANGRVLRSDFDGGGYQLPNQMRNLLVMFACYECQGGFNETKYAVTHIFVTHFAT